MTAREGNPNDPPLFGVGQKVEIKHGYWQTEEEASYGKAHQGEVGTIVEVREEGRRLVLLPTGYGEFRTSEMKRLS